MSEKKTLNTIRIDAADKSFGRLASKVAALLRGKDLPSFRPNIAVNRVVCISNIKKIKFTGKKFDRKVYHYHTVYLGGLKTNLLKDLFEKNPEKVFTKTVYGMLPKNKLRRVMIKHLKFSTIEANN